MAGRAMADNLLRVHGELRSELAAVREVVDRLAAGTATFSDARSVLNQTAVRQQRWYAGAGCSAYCMFVSMHHVGEDDEVFPRLRDHEVQLDAVLERLGTEHGMIHEVVDRIDRCLVGLVSGTSAVAELQATVDLLAEALLSHLAYEEAQLLEPLAWYFG